MRNILAHTMLHGRGILRTGATPPLTLDDFPEVLYAWEPDGFDGAHVVDDTIGTWTAAKGGINLTAAGTPSLSYPRFVPSAYTANGYPALRFGSSTGNVSMESSAFSSLAQPYTIVHVMIDPLAGITKSPFSRAPSSRTGGFLGGEITIAGSSKRLRMNAGAGATDSGVDTSVPSDGSRLSVRVERWDGANSSVWVNGTQGGDINPGSSALTSFRLCTDPADAQQSEEYYFASYILSGSISSGRLTEFVDGYITPKFRPTFSAGSFPKFTATDYYELDANDLPEADLATITSNWTDRQKGYVFSVSGTPTMHATAGPYGGKAVRFNGNGYFGNSSFNWSQPVTLVCEIIWDNYTGGHVPQDSNNGANRCAIVSNGGVHQIFSTGLVSNTLWQDIRFQGWRHANGVFNGASSLVGYDGQLLVTGNPGGGGYQGGRIGADPGNVAPFRGWLSWAAAWDIALTQAQLLEVAKYRGML